MIDIILIVISAVFILVYAIFAIVDAKSKYRYKKVYVTKFILCIINMLLFGCIIGRSFLILDGTRILIYISISALFILFFIMDYIFHFAKK